MEKYKEQIEKEAPLMIWANIYNPIKPNSWDLFHTENNAVLNSIGAKTHCYVHEKIAERIRIEYAISVLEEIRTLSSKPTMPNAILNKITELKNKIDGK